MATNTSTTHHSAVSRFFRNPDTGELVIVQLPNIPLWIFIVAAVAKRVLHPHGAVGTAVSIVAAVSLVVWAVGEIARGESPFRRVLGAVVLVVTALGLLLR